MSIEVRSLFALALATCLAAPAAAQTTATVPAPPAAASPGAGTASPTTATFADPSTAWHLYGGLGFGAADGKYGDVLQKPLQWEVRIAKESASGTWRFGAGLQLGVADRLRVGEPLGVVERCGGFEDHRRPALRFEPAAGLDQHVGVDDGLQAMAQRARVATAPRRFPVRQLIARHRFR